MQVQITIALLSSIFIAGCGNFTPMPPGTENQHSFFQEVRISPYNATKVIYSAAIKCDRNINGAGGGIDVESHFDETTNTGKVDIFSITFGDKEAPDSFWNSRLSVNIQVTPIAEGSKVIITSPAPVRAYVYSKHIAKLFDGTSKCGHT